MNSDVLDKIFLKKLTILYVEDEETTAELTAQALSWHCTTLITARNGAEGVEKYTAHLPDIVITDIAMPVMDGLTMAADIRALDRSVPIIVLTAFESTDYLKRMIDIGIDRYIAKPVIPGQLLSSLLFCTHRIRLERQLEMSERQLRSITDSTTDAIIMIDTTGLITFWNPSATTILGYTLQESLGKNIHELLAPPRYHADHTAAFEQFQLTGHGNAINKTVELNAIRKDGQEIVVELSLSAHQQGQEWHAIGILRDITARKQMEQENRKRSEEQRVILGNAGIGISLVQNRTVKWVNTTFCEIFGYSAGEMTDASTGVIYPSQDEYDQFTLDAYSVLVKGETAVRDLHLKRHDGTLFPARVIVKALDPAAPHESSIWIFDDMTAQKKLEDKLQESHKLLETLSRQVPGMIYQYRIYPDGRFCIPYTSEAIKEIFGVTPEQVREDATALFTIIHPEDIDGVVASIVESAHTLQPWEHEFRVTHAHLGVRWLHGIARPENISDGSVLWHGFITDMTRSKEMEHLLSNTIEAANTLDGLASLVGVLDVHGTIVRTNQAWNQFTEESHHGKKLSGVGSNYLATIQACSDVCCRPSQKLIACFASLVDGTLPEVVYDYHCIYHGTDHWFTRKASSFIAAGSTYVAIVDTDITWRKKAESRLEKLSLAIEFAPVAIEIANVDGVIEYINPCFTKISGYTPEEAIGQNHRFLESGKTPPETYVSLCKTLRDKKTWEGELINKRKDGSIYVDRVFISPILNDQSTITHFISVKEDISERKEFEGALIRAKEQAEAGRRAKSEFLAVVSHEIRTSLNGVIGMTEILMESELTDEQREYGENIGKCSKSLLQIIDDMMTYSTGKDSELVVRIDDFNLEELLTGIMEKMNDEAQKAELEITLRMLPGVPKRLKGDSRHLQQILINLLGNAIKFTNSGGILLYVTSGKTGHDPVEVRFEVHDTGIGFPESKYTTIFEPFTQLDSTASRNYEGTGLGLAICKQLVKLLGGQIGVTSQVGSGSVFWFTLQFEKQTAEATRISGTQSVTGLDLMAVRSTHRILVSDANIINRNVFKRMMTTLGYPADFVDSGQAALTALEKVDYDLLLLDCRLSIRDGYEDTASIRSPESKVINRNIPVIAAAANVLGSDRDAYRNAGISDFVDKPVKKDKLSDVLDRWLLKE